jgi:hypothetical protein
MTRDGGDIVIGYADECDRSGMLLLLVPSGSVIGELEGISAFRVAVGGSPQWSPRQSYR